MTQTLRSLTLAALVSAVAPSAFGAVAITAVTPLYGPAAGGTVVVIDGTDLAGVNTVAEVKFGGAGGTNAASIVSSNATQVVVTTPPLAQGTHAVYVTDGGSNDTYATNFVAYEAGIDATLDVVVTATLNQTLYLAWTANTTDGITPVTEGDVSDFTWAIGAVSLGQVVTTAGVGGYNFELRNTGNGTIDISVACSDTSTWNSADALNAGANTYSLGISLDDGTNWTAITAAGADVAGWEDTGVNVTREFDLRFMAPISSTVFGAQTMRVVLTAHAVD